MCATRNTKYVHLDGWKGAEKDSALNKGLQQVDTTNKRVQQDDTTNNKMIRQHESSTRCLKDVSDPSTLDRAIRRCH